jgi:hypothetical protein
LFIGGKPRPPSIIPDRLETVTPDTPGDGDRKQYLVTVDTRRHSSRRS